MKFTVLDVQISAAKLGSVNPRLLKLVQIQGLPIIVTYGVAA